MKENDLVVFESVDPICRNLLGYIQELKKKDSLSRQRYLHLLQSQQETLHTLYASLQHLFSIQEHEILVSRRNSLAFMSEYFVIPLIHILKHTFSMEEKEHQEAVCFTLQCACVQETCQVLQFFFMQIFQEQDIDTSVALLQSQDVQRRQKCIMALVLTLRCILEEQPRTGSYLYHGDDCILHLLTCLNTIIQGNSYDIPFDEWEQLQNNVSRYNTSCTELGQHYMSASDLTSIWDGALLMLIIHSCVTLLSAEETSAGLNAHPGGHASLKLAALSLFETLLFLTEKGDTQIRHKWRAFFPGCFGAIYRVARTHIQSSHTQSSTKLASHSLLTLAWLLRITVTNPKENSIRLDESHKIISIPSSWTVKAMNRNIDPDAKQGNSSSGLIPSDEFWINLNRRVPFHLVHIMTFLPNHKSCRLKRLAVDCFFRCILVDTYSAWLGHRDSSDDTVQTDFHQDGNWLDTAMEYLLTMVSDDDETIVSLSKEVLLLHEPLIPMARWKQNEVIVARIIELIQCVRTLAQTQKSEELLRNIRLIVGYLTSFDLCNPSESKFILSTLEDSLSNKDTWRFISDILVLDSSITKFFNAAIIGDSSSSIRKDFTIKFRPSQAVNFKYLTKETFSKIQLMVRNIVKLIGWKKCVLLIDSLIADLYDIFLERARLCESYHSKSHGEWLSSMCGTLVLINEILVSLGSVHLEHPFLLSALATAILPLILSDTWWNLPTTIEVANLIDSSPTSVKASDERILSSYFKTDKPLFQLTSVRPLDREFREVASCALQTNAYFISLSLEIICSLCSILQNDVCRFVPSILYPIVQRVSDMNHVFVRQAARSSLEQICFSLRMSSLRELFSEYFDLIMESICRDIQRSSISIDSSNYFTVFVGMNSLIGVVEQMISIPYQTPVDITYTDKITTQTMQLLGMLETIISWFDNSFEKSRRSLNMYIDIPLGLLKVLIVAMIYLSNFFNECVDLSTVKNQFDDDGSFTTPPWMNCLQEFLIQPIRPDFSDMNLRTARSTGDTVLRADRYISITVLTKGAKVSRRTLSICSFFLSLDDVRVQRSTCEALKYALITLSRIEKHVKAHSIDTDQNSDLMNPVLVSVSYFWANIELNLRSSIKMFLHEGFNSCPMDKEEDYLPQKQLRENISNTLRLVVICCDLSGDFMAERFKTGAWPEIRKLLAYYSNTRPHVGVDSSIICQVTMDAIDSIQDLFSMDHFSCILQDIIPVLGTLLIPLLGEMNDLGKKSFTLMKSLLKIDCDTFWRALASIGGLDEEDLIHTRARDLLKFVETLPEQTV